MLPTSRATLAWRSVGAKSVAVALAVADGAFAVPSRSVPTARTSAARTAAPARLTARRGWVADDPDLTGWYTGENLGEL